MKVWPVLFAAAPAVGFLIGVSREPDIGTPEPQEMAVPAAPSLVHSGTSISIARQRLAGVGTRIFVPAPAIMATGTQLPVAFASEALPPPADQSLMDAPPPPPPVDIADRFSRGLTAVVRGSEGPTLLMVDGSNPQARRSLRRGEAYLDGWRVQEINRSEIVLRKGDSERRIPVMQGAPRPTPIALAPPPVQAAFAAPPPEVEGGGISAGYQIEDASAPAAAEPPPSDEAPRPRRRISRPGRQ